MIYNFVFNFSSSDVSFIPVNTSANVLPAVVLTKMKIQKESYKIWDLINRVRAYFFWTKLCETGRDITYLMNRDLSRIGQETTELNSEQSEEVRTRKVAEKIFKFIQDQSKELVGRGESTVFSHRFETSLANTTIFLNSGCDFRNTPVKRKENGVRTTIKIQDIWNQVLRSAASTLEEAVVSWNTAQPQDRLIPDPSKTIELGRTIFIHYSRERGYWLEKINKQEAGERTSYWYDDSQFGPAQKEKINHLKDLFDTASQSLQDKSSEEIWDINLAKIEAIFGHEAAEAYFAVMHLDSRNRFDELFPRSKEATEKLFQVLPNLEKIIEEMQRKAECFNIKNSKLADFLSDFYEVANIEIRDPHNAGYWKRLYRSVGDVDRADNTSSSLDIISGSPMCRMRNVFALFVSKVMDAQFSISATSMLPSVIGVMEGFLTDTLGIDSICEDLKAFCRACEKKQKKVDPLIEKSISILEFASTVPICSQTKHTILKTAKRIVQKLTEQLEGETILIPGGYPGHFFLYEVTKTDKDKYSVAIIDTSGELPGLSHNVGFLGRCQTTSECVFTEITLEDLKPEFFVDLWEISTRCGEIRIKDIIIFLKRYWKVEARLGGSLRRQFLGTCIIKPVVEWLFKVLPVITAVEFDDFMIERSMRLVQTEYEAATDISKKIIFGEKSAEDIIKKFKKISDFRLFFNEELLKNLKEKARADQNRISVLSP